MLSFSKEDRKAIAAEWLEKTLETYPAQSQRFLRSEGDLFRNPVGHILREHLPVLAEVLLGGDMDRDRLTHALEAIIRVRAVQNFTPSQSVAFVCLLKRILRDRWKGPEKDWLTIETRIDETALLAFDLYMKCREKIYKVTADEGRRRVACLERIYWGAEPR